MSKCCYISNGLSYNSDGTRVPCGGYTGVIYNDFSQIDPQTEPGCWEKCLQFEHAGLHSPRTIMERDYASKYPDNVWYFESRKLDLELTDEYPVQDFRYINLSGNGCLNSDLHGQLHTAIKNKKQVIVNFTMTDIELPSWSVCQMLENWERVKIVYSIDTWPSEEQKRIMKWWDDYSQGRGIRIETRTKVDEYNIWILPQLFDLISSVTQYNGFKSFIVKDNINLTESERPVIKHLLDTIVDERKDTWIATQSSWDHNKQKILLKLK